MYEESIAYRVEIIIQYITPYPMDTMYVFIYNLSIEEGFFPLIKLITLKVTGPDVVCFFVISLFNTCNTGAYPISIFNKSI